MPEWCWCRWSFLGNDCRLVIGSLTRSFSTDVTLPHKLSVGRRENDLNWFQLFSVDHKKRSTWSDSDINVLAERNQLSTVKQLYNEILWLFPNLKTNSQIFKYPDVLFLTCGDPKGTSYGTIKYSKSFPSWTETTFRLIHFFCHLVFNNFPRTRVGHEVIVKRGAYRRVCHNHLISSGSQWNNCYI